MKSACLLSLLLGYASLWIKKTPWIWGGFLVLSLLSAVSVGILQTAALIPLALFALFLLSLFFPLTGLARLLLVSCVFLIAGAIFYGFLPWFPPFFIPEINYSKSLIGLALLGAVVPTIDGKEAFLKAVKRSFLFAVLAAIFFLLSFTAPPFSAFSLVSTLLPEEALLRGFVQKELFSLLGKGPKAHIGALLISACLFPLFHLTWGADPSLLLPLFAEGFLCALLYEITQTIESPILFRFLIELF